MGFDSLISFSVGKNPNDSFKTTLQIFGAGPFFPNAFYGVNEKIRSYEEEVTKALMDNVHGKLFNASILLQEVPASCLMDEAARDAVDFERRLAEIGLSDRGSSTTKFYSHEQAVGKLSLLTPSIDWALALDQILPAGTGSNVSITLPRSRVLQDLEDLLQSTPPRKLQNFLSWLVMREVMRLFSQRGSLDIVKDMAGSVRMALQEGLTNSTMLRGSTAEEAIRKVASVLIHVGYATNLQSPESLQEFYKNYVVNLADYFGNLLRCQAGIQERSYESLKDQARSLEPFVLPQSVGAGYYIQSYAYHVLIPAGVMQHPMFYAQGPDMPSPEEIGSMTPPGVKLTNAYAEKAQCFIDHYNGFEVNSTNGTTYSVNGTRTLTENIADNEALKVAFRAWKSRYRSDPHGQRYKNFKLPGLEDQTPEKLFFVSYARHFCEALSPSSLDEQIKTDAHSPSSVRVNGAVQNSIDFARAFNCREKAAMNPVKKCSMWQ
ncbi:Neprilysin-4 [Mortierella alpina]|nr:Neprilysin-4 [Mortierella alpina]